MKTIIPTLTQIVVDSKTLDDAAFTIAEKFPEISVSAAEGVAKDTNDFIEGNISESNLSLYLVEVGLHPKVA